MNLYQGIRESINVFGAEVIKSNQLLNALMDYQAFEFKAQRTVLRAMINDGLTEKLYIKYIKMDDVDEAYLGSIVLQLTQQGFQQGHAKYVVYSLAKALGWVDETPVYEVKHKDADSVATREIDVNGISLAMCEIVGGKFSMGATPEQGISANFDERPSVDVEVNSFYMSDTPITQDLWCAVMPENPSHFKGDSLPVERVTWEECNEFINKLNCLTGENFRLPTEAEWEYAARGGQLSGNTKYAGADEDFIDDYVWYKDNSQASTHAVKSKQPNELGLYDMSGNVAEWCQDWYFGSYANNTSSINPKGPAQGLTKVIRGGSWNDKAINCRTSKRNSLNPSYRNKQVGFRLVKDM